MNPWERAYVVVLEENGVGTCYGPFASASLCQALIQGWYTMGANRKATFYAVERP